METASLPDSIQVTRAVYEQLKEKFAFEARGALDIKGKGAVELDPVVAPAEAPHAITVTAPPDAHQEIEIVTRHGRGLEQWPSQDIEHGRLLSLLLL
jgi:hypothetical protein